MTKNRLARVLKIAAIGAIGITVVGQVVTHLWNWLMPVLFGLHVITFWQTIGLLVLSRIFFGGFRGRPGFGGGPWRRRMMERWEQMTPEQREQFRQGMRGGGRCGKFEPPTAEPQAL